MQSELRQQVSEYKAYCRAKRISSRTLEWYDQKLARFVNHCETSSVIDIAALCPATVYTLLEDLEQQGVSSYTVKGYVQVIRGFLHWAEKEELVSPRVRKRVELPKFQKRVIRVLSRDQFDRLVDASVLEPTHWLALRDRAILHVLLDTGMRVSELCGVLRTDVQYDTDDPHILIRGKGDKERGVGPLGRFCLRELRRYLRACPYRSDRLFVNRNGRLMSRGGVDQLFDRLHRWAGPEHFIGIHVSAHTLRHTYAVTHMRTIGDIKRLSMLLGHSSVVVTENYLRDFQQREARRGQSVLDAW